MFEKSTQKLATKPKFYKRVIKGILTAFTIITLSLLMGMAGYHYLEKLPWIDAFLNASMILSGMGPVNPINSYGGKLFAGLYALFSGIVFLISIAIVLAPLFHRFLHKFHVEERDQ